MLNSKAKLVTHDGSFHADDLFACATLCLYLEKKKIQYEIVRSREESEINSAQYVFDVGLVYDPSQNRFDHHQREGAGKRENGILYSSFGLIWLHFGMELCDGNSEVWKLLDTKLVSPIDAVDNGMDIAEPKYEGMQINLDKEYRLYAPTWREPFSDLNKIFIEQVERIKTRIAREIKVAIDEIEGRDIIVDAYKKSASKEIIVLDVAFPRYMYQQVLSSFAEPMYVVVPEIYGSNWKTEAISKSKNTMESRKLFPEDWRKTVGDPTALASITGVADVVFCHRAGFLVHTKSKESAIKLAQIALKS